jgi:hypothetical protein
MVWGGAARRLQSSKSRSLHSHKQKGHVQLRVRVYTESNARAKRKFSCDVESLHLSSIPRVSEFLLNGIETNLGSCISEKTLLHCADVDAMSYVYQSLAGAKRGHSELPCHQRRKRRSHPAAKLGTQKGKEKSLAKVWPRGSTFDSTESRTRGQKMSSARCRLPILIAAGRSEPKPRVSECSVDET